MDFSLVDIELQIENIYSKMVYSDDEEFYDEPSPEKIIFVCKKGNDSYVTTYNTILHTFKHYKVPNYNRNYATMSLRLPSDPPTKTDVNGNELLINSYLV